MNTNELTVVDNQEEKFEVSDMKNACQSRTEEYEFWESAVRLFHRMFERNGL